VKLAPQLSPSLGHFFSPLAMLQTVGAILVIGIGYVVLASAGPLPPTYQTALSVLMPLVCFGALAWAFVPNRKRRGDP
jgi:hypothetical protein